MTFKRLIEKRGLTARKVAECLRETAGKMRPPVNIRVSKSYVNQIAAGRVPSRKLALVIVEWAGPRRVRLADLGIEVK